MCKLFLVYIISAPCADSPASVWEAWECVACLVMSLVTKYAPIAIDVVMIFMLWYDYAWQCHVTWYLYGIYMECLYLLSIGWILSWLSYHYRIRTNNDISDIVSMVTSNLYGVVSVITWWINELLESAYILCPQWNTVWQLCHCSYFNIFSDVINAKASL